MLTRGSRLKRTKVWSLCVGAGGTKRRLERARALVEHYGADGRFMIGVLGISVVDMAGALSGIDDRIRSGMPGYVCMPNVRMTLLSQGDRRLCKIMNESFLTLPDGMPLVWCARLAGLRNLSRVTGPDLMLNILARSHSCGYSHYFLGDTGGTLSRMAEVIRRKYPRAVVKAMRSPPFRPLSSQEMNGYVEEINELRPSFVWVALGGAKQVFWMADVVGRVRSSLLIGVGAAFRFLTGQYNHPPELIQKCGLEGICWRFRREPLELMRRYSRFIPAYGWLAAKTLARRGFNRPT